MFFDHPELAEFRASSLPCLDDDVLLAKVNGCKSIYEILNFLQFADCGKNYKLVRASLNHLNGTFYDDRKLKPLSDVYFKLSCYRVKRLYRYLDKKSFKNASFVVSVDKLCRFLSLSYRYNSEIKRILDRYNEELKKAGLLRWWRFFYKKYSDKLKVYYSFSDDELTSEELEALEKTGRWKSYPQSKSKNENTEPDYKEIPNLITRKSSAFAVVTALAVHIR